jgi:Flp pilus assembly protein TadD
MRDRARRRDKAPALPTLSEGAAESIDFAAAFMNANRQTELSMIYLRLALRLDPSLDRSWMMIGDSLAKVHDDAAARQAWSKVPTDSIYFSESRAKIIYSLQGERQDEAALQLAAETARDRPTDPRARLTYADLLRTSGRHAEALALLDGLIADGHGDWRIRYMRAMSLDKLGRWPEAEAELHVAMGLSADQPEVLNYLGYAWIDRGEKVREGMALVERAVAGRPTSGAIQDSLAWAHFKLGDYRKAVEMLESAVVLTPGNPEVNDHLGDAYWMVGRRDEANFQWRRVLTLDPSVEVKARAERKLKEGLPPPALRSAAAPST